MSEHPSAERLHLFIENRLSAAEGAKIGEHLERCGECQAYLDALPAFSDASAVSPDESPNRRAKHSQPMRANIPESGSPDSVDSQATGPEYGHRRTTDGISDRPAHDRNRFPSIPGYEILEELGHGGMGIVYKARQTSLNRVVALKMISGGGHLSEQHLLRFRAEAEAVASLKHPNVVQIYEIGEWKTEGSGSAVPYISLEFVEYGSLASRLNSTPQPPRQAAALVERIARAVDFAHQHGIVHRDLKPANILLADAPDITPLDALTPKITDFGLAKRVEEAGNTQTGAILGTPSYMAPEQAAGKSREIGTPADVYALGAILYEMLTGRPPFKGESVQDTLHQVQYQEPVPPSRLQPKVPRDLETVCLKCLRKTPNDRYGTATELADDLQRFLDGKPILARPVSLRERALKWIRRNPATTAFIAAVTLGLTAAGFGWIKHRQVTAAAAEIQRNRIQSHLDGARLAMQKGDWREVLASYERAEAEGEAPTPRFLLKKIRAWLATNDIGRAKRELDALANNPTLESETATVDLYCGQILVGIDNARAEELVRRAISKGPLEVADKLWAEGMIASNSLDALQCFQRALVHDPYHQEARELAGGLLLSLGRLEEATSHLNQSEALFPDNPIIQIQLILVETLQAKKDRAVARLKHIEAHTPLSVISLLRAIIEDYDPARLYSMANEPTSPMISRVSILTKYRPILLQLVDLPQVTEEQATTRSVFRFPFYFGNLNVRPNDLLFGVLAPRSLFDRFGRVLPTVIAVHPEATLHYFYALSLMNKAKAKETNGAAVVSAYRETHEVLRRATEQPAISPIRELILDLLISVEAFLGTQELTQPDPHMRELAITHIRERLRVGLLPASQTELMQICVHIARRSGEYDLARLILADWQKQRPRGKGILRSRAWVELDAGAYGPAIRAAREALASDPDDRASKDVLDIARRKWRAEYEEFERDAR